MNELDKWSAEQCGIYITETYWAAEDRKSNFQGIWMLTDPRCMQIFREWWLKQNVRHSVHFFSDGEVSYCKAGVPLWTRINELACATAVIQKAMNSTN